SSPRLGLAQYRPILTEVSTDTHRSIDRYSPKYRPILTAARAPRLRPALAPRACAPRLRPALALPALALAVLVRCRRVGRLGCFAVHRCRARDPPFDAEADRDRLIDRAAGDVALELQILHRGVHVVGVADEIDSAEWDQPRLELVAGEQRAVECCDRCLRKPLIVVELSGLLDRAVAEGKTEMDALYREARVETRSRVDVAGVGDVVAVERQAIGGDRVRLAAR